jgi:hypothetical protein
VIVIDVPESTQTSAQGGGIDIASNDTTIGGDVVGRDKISITNINQYSSGKEEAQSSERGFLIGEQLRIARDDTGLQPPRFIELIDFHGEQQYRKMEANTTECPESVIDRIYKATGILPGWLKDPTEQKKCEVEFTDDWRRCPREAARQISQLSTGEIYVTIAASIPARDRLLWRGKNLWAKATMDYLHVGICVPIAEYRYKIFDTNFSADFENAHDRERYALPFYSFLYELFDRFDLNCHGIILSDFKDDKVLYKGKVHPRKILSSQKAFWRINWVQRVLEQRDNLDWSYVTKNCGSWIKNMQRIFLDLGKDVC